jgi:hypothetical protein
VLTFIGVKMLLVAVGVNIPIWFSLVFVAVVLILSVIASLFIKGGPDTHIEVDLPPDFNLPLGEDPPETLAEAEEEPEEDTEERQVLKSGR